ncbi:MAG: choice-of-anchor Q domain-containing protein [Bacteroidota bacterium]
MKWLLSILVFSILFVSCKKETFITSGDARMTISADTLKFDTVFTTIGSVTQSFKIRNDNNQKLRISGIRLLGGASSSYQLNIDGQAVPAAADLELAANDSLYVFVKVTINPNTTNLPFIVRDSIKVDFNGNTKWVQLQAYGQNARFLKNQRIATNTTWNNQLPYVILGGVTVDTFATLTIDKGTRIYCNANAPIIVHGTLKVNGEKDTSNRVYFRGDRLDPDYKDLPGGWPGIIFTNPSKDNVLNYAVIKNAYQALVVSGGIANMTPKLILNECIIDNAYDIGLFAFNSFINSRNCLFSNCGNEANLGEGGSNILVRGGGIYNFDYATIATFSNVFQLHKQPVVYLSNSGGGTSTAPLTANFNNSIIYGEGGLADNELVTDKQATSFAYSVTLNNVLYRAKTDPANLNNPTGILKNTSPVFDTINTSRRTYDFRLRANESPCINKGAAATSILTDLDGTPRKKGVATDLGCYERQ